MALLVIGTIACVLHNRGHKAWCHIPLKIGTCHFYETSFRRRTQLVLLTNLHRSTLRTGDHAYRHILPGCPFTPSFRGVPSGLHATQNPTTTPHARPLGPPTAPYPLTPGPPLQAQLGLVSLLIVQVLGGLDGFEGANQRAQPRGVPLVRAAAVAVHVREVDHAHVRLRR
eukprot:5876301-Pyramimonas_sp.AAC.1